MAGRRTLSLVKEMTQPQAEEYIIYRLRNLGVFVHEKAVDISTTRRTLGNKSWGMIDFLRNHRGFRLEGLDTYSRFHFN